MLWSRAFWAWVACALAWSVTEAKAEDPALPQVIEFRYTPTGRAQIAIWIEDGAGQYLATVGLTDAVATRGIGNRPGASQMNSGFRWPFGRREGVLPIWAHSRASAPNAKLWKRIVFQNRPEGWASRKVEDSSPDNYFCLAWDQKKSKQEALDAVSCASVFSSDKGRYMTEADVAAGYGEPFEDVITRAGRLQPMAAESLYPPRRDITPCSNGCAESKDAASYAAHAREVMPEIDAVTMATQAGDKPARALFTVPPDWAPGMYRACLEINVEGDYNSQFDAAHYPTPKTPAPLWDSWATNQGYGYPYRGQPSVAYCTEFRLGAEELMEFTADVAEGGVGTWDTSAEDYGTLSGMDGMTDDPVAAPGSGGDRLRKDGDGHRLRVIVKPPMSCEGNTPPGPVDALGIEPYPNQLHAHEWVAMSFMAASDDTAIFRYEVRVSTEPIRDEASFMRGQVAKNATVAAEELDVPAGTRPGTMVHVDMGGLVQGTHYYVGVRAVDGCAAAGDIRVTEVTTPMRTFATVTPCFVATAAYGSPLAAEIGALRRFRDRQLSTHWLGRQLVAAYNVVGPILADRIREHDSVRAAVRSLLSPLVAVAHWLDD